MLARPLATAGRLAPSAPPEDVPSVRLSKTQRIITIVAGVTCLSLVVLAVRARTAMARVSVRETLLVHQNRALESLVGEAPEGDLVAFDGVLIVVEEGLVRDILRAATPLEAEVGGGFRIRVDRADATFSDGVALIRLTGIASVIGGQESSQVTVTGAIDIVELSPETGALQCKVSILGVEAQDPTALGQPIPLGEITEALADGGLALLLGSIEIPVSIENPVTIPAVASKHLAIGAESVPLTIGVAKVKVFARRLWVFVDAAFVTGPRLTEAGSTP